VTIPEEGRPRLAALTSQIDAITAQIAVHPPNEAQLTVHLQELQLEYSGLYDQYAHEDRAAPLKYALGLLNTLRIEPLEATTTTIAPGPSTSLPSITPLPATTIPPFVPSTDDEGAIQQLFVAWLRDHPDDETRLIVEDADALLDSIHQGLAQHTAEDLAGYSGTVSAIRMIDADHADVDYTLLHNGLPQFGRRTGAAVRVNGRWMVSRDTECSLLALGGISCPA
jgi:hypothetical protein